jgi:hypothetical protein
MAQGNLGIQPGGENGFVYYYPSPALFELATRESKQ